MAISSASMAAPDFLPPRRFLSFVRADDLCPEPALGTSDPSKHHVPSAFDLPADTTSYPASSHICAPPMSSSQSPSLVQIVSLDLHGVSRCSLSSVKYSSLHAR